MSSSSSSAARVQAQEVDASLLAIDRVRKRVPGDGSCLFRVVALAIYGLESQHRLVRRECVDFIWRNRSTFEAFCLDYGSFDSYVENMARDNVWGGEMELQAMSLLYRCARSCASVCAADNTHTQPAVFRFVHSCAMHMTKQRVVVEHRRNFVLHAAKREPIRMDNQFEHDVELWFANNEHYDAVFTTKKMQVLSFAQRKSVCRRPRSRLLCC